MKGEFKQDVSSDSSVVEWTETSDSDSEWEGLDKPTP